MKDEFKLLKKAADYIADKIDHKPEIAMILGSGLGELAEELTNSIEISFKDIPGFPLSSVEGHQGALACGLLSGIPVIILKGRAHFYEGFSMPELVRPVRVLSLLGIKQLILTNAAGGINKKLSAGSLMMIEDHISLFCENPLRGSNIEELGTRFPDMSEIYNRTLNVHIANAAQELKIPLQTGIYAYTQGPSYETPSEIKLLKQMGADAVGMSTVPEAIAANHCGMTICGVSCITNMAAGIQGRRLNHAEVIQTAARVKYDFKNLIRTALIEMNEDN